MPIGIFKYLEVSQLKRKFHPFVLVILGLALFGIIHQLIFNTAQLVTQIIFISVIVLVLFLLYRNFMRNKYKTPNNKTVKPPTLVKKIPNNVIPHRTIQKSKRVRQRPLNRRGSTPNLTVIEGKKGKKQKKNRALF